MTLQPGDEIIYTGETSEQPPIQDVTDPLAITGEKALAKIGLLVLQIEQLTQMLASAGEELEKLRRENAILRELTENEVTESADDDDDWEDD